MSFGSASAENSVSKAFYSLTLMAGIEAVKENKARPVDLNVRGGGIFHKNLVVCGNIDVQSFLNGNVNGDIYTNQIMAANLTEGIHVVGNLIIDNEFSLQANLILANTIAPLNGTDLTIQATDMIILNAPTVVVTGNLQADTICANVVKVDTLESCTSNIIEVANHLLPAESNVFCLGGPDRYWNKIYTEHLVATGSILGNVMNMNIVGNLVVADIFCATNEIQTNKIVPKSGNLITLGGDLNMNGGNILNVTNISPVSMGGNIVVNANLDMMCGAIYNLQKLKVNDVYGKHSPVYFQDELNIASAGSRITFEDGIEIGNTATTASASTAIAIGKDASAAAQYSIAIGAGAVASNVYGIAIGSGYSPAQALGYGSIVIGTNTYMTPTSKYSILIGYQTYTNSYDSIVIGRRATAYGNGYYNIAIGKRAESGASYATAVGPFASAGGFNNVAIGSSAATETDINTISIGYSCANSARNGVALGPIINVHYQAVEAVAIGYNNTVFGASSIVIGNNTQNTLGAINSIAIGTIASASQQNAIAIGYAAMGNIPNSIALGSAAAPTGYDRAFALNINSASVITSTPPHLRCVVNGVDREIPLTISGLGNTGGNVSILRIDQPSTPQSIPTGAIGANLTLSVLDVHNFDEPGSWSGDVFTVNKAGWYQLNAAADFEPLNQVGSINFLINNDETKCVGHSQLYSSGSNAVMSIDCTSYLGLGDQVSVRVKQDTGSSKNVYHSHFAIYALSGLAGPGPIVSADDICANVQVLTDKIVPKTGGNIVLDGNLIVTETLYVGNIAGNSPVTCNDDLIVLGQLITTGGISPTSGGTGQTSWTTGDLLYASATNTLAKRSIGSNGQFLGVSGGVPAWQTPSVSAVTAIYAGTGITCSPNPITGTGTVSLTNSAINLSPGYGLYGGGSVSLGGSGGFSISGYGERNYNYYANGAFYSVFTFGAHGTPGLFDGNSNVNCGSRAGTAIHVNWKLTVGTAANVAAMQWWGVLTAWQSSAGVWSDIQYPVNDFQRHGSNAPDSPSWSGNGTDFITLQYKASTSFTGYTDYMRFKCWYTVA